MSRSRYRESVCRIRFPWMYEQYEKVEEEFEKLHRYRWRTRIVPGSRTPENLWGAHVSVRIEQNLHEVKKEHLRRIRRYEGKHRHALSAVGWPHSGSPHCANSYSDVSTPKAKRYAKKGAARRRRLLDKSLCRAEIVEFYDEKADFEREMRLMELQEDDWFLENRRWEEDYEEYLDGDDDDYNDREYEEDYYTSSSSHDHYDSMDWMDDWMLFGRHHVHYEPAPAMVEERVKTVGDVLQESLDRLAQVTAEANETMKVLEEALQRSDGTQTQEQLVDLIARNAAEWSEEI